MPRDSFGNARPAMARVRLVLMPGAGATAVLRAILSALPVDRFEPYPAVVIDLLMEVLGQPDTMPEAVADITPTLANLGMDPQAGLRRQVFDRVAKHAFAIVRTGEHRLYGNLILTTGAVR